MEQVIFEYISYPIYFYYCQQVLFTLKVSSPLNDTSVGFEASFQFSREVEFLSLLYVHITLPTDTEGETPCLARLLQCEKHFESFSI